MSGVNQVSTIQKEILDSFFTKLADFEEIDEDLITALRNTLDGNSKPKIAELIEIFSEPEEDIL